MKKSLIVFSLIFSLSAFAQRQSAFNYVPIDSNFTLNPGFGSYVELLSKATDNQQGNSNSSLVSLSEDGTLAAFESYAENFVYTNWSYKGHPYRINFDTNNVADIFLRDRNANTTVRVSLDNNDQQSAGAVIRPSISGEGRYIAFESPSDLAGIGTGGIFRRDTVLGITQALSLDHLGASASLSRYPSISSDGSRVAFESQGTLTLDDTNGGQTDIFVRDVLTNTTLLISEMPAGGTHPFYDSNLPKISDDGEHVLFTSSAPLDADYPSSTGRQIYLRDLNTNITELLSMDTLGDPAGTSHDGYALSGDARYVVLESANDDMVFGDENGFTDVVLIDRLTGERELISISSAGVQGNGQSVSADISADGRYVTYISHADNLVSDDTNNQADVFVRDRQAQVTTRINTNWYWYSTTQANAGSYKPSISANGGYVAWHTSSTNLFSDANGADLDVVGKRYKHINQVPVSFTCNNGITQFGENVYVVGGHYAIGNWDTDKAVLLIPSAYPSWSASVDIPSGTGSIAWKCIIKRNDGGIDWQSGSDNIFSTPANGSVSQSASF